MSGIFNQINAQALEQQKTISEPTKKHAAKTADKKTVRPSVITPETTNTDNKVRGIFDSLEATPQRRKIRTGFDVFEDQLERLVKLKSLVREKFNKKISIGEMVREALDTYIEQNEGKIK